jgi:hypothetical protein
MTIPLAQVTGIGALKARAIVARATGVPGQLAGWGGTPQVPNNPGFGGLKASAKSPWSYPEAHLI